MRTAPRGAGPPPARWPPRHGAPARWARAALAALGVALAACAGDPTPAAPPAATPGPPPTAEVVVAGEVSVEVRGGARAALPGAEVHFVPEEAMRPFVAARLEQASAGLRQLRLERDRAAAELRRLLAETDRTNQAWKQSNEYELRRRLEVQVRPPRGPDGVGAVHRELLAEKRAAWDRAAAAARRSEQAERAYDALQVRASRYRDGPYFLEGLPPATRSATTGADGSFRVSLPPGRYAVVATGELRQGVASELYSWLVWTRVEDGLRLVLGSANLHGSDCASCVVAVRGLPD